MVPLATLFDSLILLVKASLHTLIITHKQRPELIQSNLASRSSPFSSSSKVTVFLLQFTLMALSLSLIPNVFLS